ncbi:MAG: hypothetical protein ACJAVI_003042 [Candidatus Azotimanducaceae bacterium]|jgi:hypothetical protein
MRFMAALTGRSMQSQPSAQKPLFDTDQIVISAFEPDDFNFLRDI